MSGKKSRKGSVDNWLEKLELYRKNIADDETCLFRAVSEQLFNCQVHHERIRKEIAEYGRTHYKEIEHLINSEKDKWFQHLDMLEKHSVICGHVEMQLISKKYSRDIIIFYANKQDYRNITNCNFPDTPLMLCLLNDDHYDAVYRKEQIENAGFCQSIVYKLLYENVFDVPNVDSIVDAMLHEKLPFDCLVDGKPAPLANEGNGISSTAEDRENNNNIIAPFPFKVAKALDPTIYRNIEYDSWNEVRRELKLSDWYYGDDKLKLGTRCVYRDKNTDETFDCYIQELHKDDDKCVIYLTKMAAKRVVKYSDLSPESDAKPWPLPYRFFKNLVIHPNTPQLMPIEKVKATRKKNKEKKQSKSANDVSSIGQESGGDISAFVGTPLQMQPLNGETQTSSKVVDSVETSTPATEVILPESSTHQPEQVSWTEEPLQWSAPVQYVSPETGFFRPPTEFVWPQTPISPYCSEYKPMVASAPATPSFVTHHDYHPFMFNYHMGQYTPVMSPGGSTEFLQHQQQQDGQQMAPLESQPNVAYVAPPMTAPLEVYPSVYNVVPPGTPVIYAPVAPSQSEVEMVVPRSPVPVYTPTTPIEMSGFVFAPAQTGSVWYQPRFTN